MRARITFSVAIACAAIAACGGDEKRASEPLPADAGVGDAKRAPSASSTAPPEVVGPSLLSETGLYSDFATKALADDVIEFTPRHPLWTDGAQKKRYLLLPPGSVIDTTDMDRWSLPTGTKMWKEFYVDSKLVETRIIAKLDDEDWWMVSYLWREDGSDADAVPEGVANAAGTEHDVPSQNDCRRCHAGGHGIPLGVSALQLSSGGSGLLSRLATEGRLSAPPASEFEIPGNDVERAALGYLHANCGHCHNDHSGLHSQSAMRLALRTTDKRVQDTSVYRTAFDLRARHVAPDGIDTVIVPGDPARSQLWVRMALRDGWGMPPIGTEVGDLAGTEAVYAWITSLAP